MARVGSAFIDVEADLTKFNTQLRDVGRQLQRIDAPDIEVDADTRPLDKKIDRTVKSTDGKFAQLKSNTSAHLKGIGATLAAAFAVDKVLEFGKSAVSAASDVNESITKNQVLFGKYAKEIERFSKTSATSFGVSRKAALEYTGVFGNLFRAIGVTQEKSSGLSVRLVKLASDMASFNNTSIEDALDALQSGLVGESEPLRRFGVTLSADAIAAQALSSGLVKTKKSSLEYRETALKVEVAERALGKAIKDHGKESLEAQQAQIALEKAQKEFTKAAAGGKVQLTNQQKAMASVELITRQTAAAQGDFARTSDGLANSQRIATARFEDLRVKVGEFLLPVIGKLSLAFTKLFTMDTSWLSHLSLNFKKAADTSGLADAAAKNLGSSIDSLKGIFTAVSDIATAAWSSFGDIFTDQVQNILKTFVEVIGGVTKTLQGFVDFIAGVFTGDWGRAWDGIKEIVEGTVRSFVAVFEYQINTLANIAKAALRAVIAAVQGIGQAFSDLGKFIVNRIADGLTTVTDALGSAGGWLKNRVVDLVEAQVNGFKSVGLWIINRIAEGFKTVTDALGSAGAWLKNRIVEAIQETADGLVGAGTWILNRVIDGFKTVTDSLSGVGGWLKNRLQETFEAAKEGITGIGTSLVNWIVTGLKSGGQAVQGFVNDIIGILNKIPGVEIGAVKVFAEGGKYGGEPGGQAAQGFARGGAFARTGGFVNRPITLMGEEAPLHPEFVIPTNPAYRKRAQGLAAQAAQAVGLQGFKKGGIFGDALGALGDLAGGAGGVLGDLLGQGAKFFIKQLPNPADALPDWLVNTGKYVAGKAVGFIKDQVSGVINSLLGSGSSEDGEAFPGGVGFARMVAQATKMDAMNTPYVYGGGHNPSFSGPWDCSGAVSAVLHAAGLLGSPVSTDGLKPFGQSGDGKLVTIGVRGTSGREAHTMIKLGNRYFESGSGHGAAWTDGWSGNFPIHRHPQGYAQGGMFGLDPMERLINAIFDSKQFGWGLRQGGMFGNAAVVPFAGSFKNGGVVPYDGFAQVHAGETVIPVGQGAGIPNFDVYIGGEKIDERVEIKLRDHDRQQGAMMRAGVN